MEIRIIGLIPSTKALKEVTDLIDYYQTTDGLNDIRQHKGRTEIKVFGVYLTFVADVQEHRIIVKI